MGTACIGELAVGEMKSRDRARGEGTATQSFRKQVALLREDQCNREWKREEGIAQIR